MHNGVRISAIAALALTVAGCNLSEPAAFDPRTLQHAERMASYSERPGRMGPLPTTMEGVPDSAPGSADADASTAGQAGPILDGRPTIRLSLQQIIHRAVAHSREVRVAGYDPAVAKTRILEAEAHFDPVFFSKATYTDQVILSPSSGILPGANPFQPDIFRTIDVQAGLRQNGPAGGTFEVRYDVQRIQRVPVAAGQLNPYTVNDLAVQITQPLLRDLGYDVNQARITIARNDYKVSVLDYRKTLEENLAELERDYWQLAEAEREEIVQEDLLARSRATYSVLRERANLDATSVQVTQADAKLKAREADLINIKQKIRTTSQNVKRRMNDPEFPVAGDVVILSEIPEVETPVHFVLKDLIATAMANRFELGQQTLREDSATIAAKVAKFNLLPKLDLVGTMDVQGPGQDFAHAFKNQGNSDFWGGSIGLSFEYPLGNREARSIYRRAMLQRLQAIEQYGFLVEQIAEDVTVALIAVESDWKSIQGRRSQKFSAEANLNAYEEMRRIGNIQRLDYQYVSQLLDAQEALGEAERQEALAIAQYYVDIAVLERAKGTLLRYNNIVMSEEQFTRNEQ
jgi:outer membrane protein TolC